jgi:hypothetical protein
VKRAVDALGLHQLKGLERDRLQTTLDAVVEPPPGATPEHDHEEGADQERDQRGRAPHRGPAQHLRASVTPVRFDYALDPVQVRHRQRRPAHVLDVGIGVYDRGEPLTASQDVAAALGVDDAQRVGSHAGIRGDSRDALRDQTRAFLGGQSWDAADPNSRSPSSITGAVTIWRRPARPGCRGRRTLRPESTATPR